MVREGPVVYGDGVLFALLLQQVLVLLDVVAELIDHLPLADELVLEVLQFRHHFVLGVTAHDVFQAVFKDADVLLVETQRVQPLHVVEVEVADVFGGCGLGGSAHGVGRWGLTPRIW